MRKCKRMLYIAVGLTVMAVLVWLGWEIYMTIPVYPDFQRDLSSIEEIKAAYAERDLLYPELSEADMVDIRYAVDLDGRTRDAEPDDGYYISWRDLSVPEASFYMTCLREEREYIPENAEMYKGIPVFTDKSQSSVANFICCEFQIDGYRYELRGSYYREGLSKERQLQLDEILAYKAREMIYKMIDDTDI